MFAGAFGIHGLLRLRPGRWTKLAISLLILGGVYQLYVNCSFALVYQRLMVWSRPDAPSVEMWNWRRSVDGFFSNGKEQNA
jgi:hypothetical protein